MVIRVIRASFLTKPVVVALLACNILELACPLAASALTSGPSQPEVQSFEPIGMNQNVNPQSGDFTYSVDLGIPDYPVNLAYHSGVTMDQEASNTGLGWNLSIGVLNRQMRGLPDDYNGEHVTKEMSMRPNWTVGVDVNFSNLEIAGWDLDRWLSLGASMGVMYNNYKGVGFKQGINVGLKGGLTLGLGSNSFSGIEVSPGLSHPFSAKNADIGASFGIGGTYSSRYGLKSIQVRSSISVKGFGAKIAGGNFSFNDNTVLPTAQMPMSNLSVDFRASVGWEAYTVNGALGLRADYSRQELAKNLDESPAYGYLYAHNVPDRTEALQDFTRAMEGKPFLKKKANNPQTQYMAFANQTYDQYSASGQGTGGAYRLVRGEAASVNDKDVNSTSLAPFNFGLEIGLTSVVKIGGDYTYTNGESRSGLWQEENPVVASKALSYKSKKDIADPFYEPAYFKASGEMTAMDEGYLSSIGGDEPVRMELERSGSVIKTTGRMKKGNNFIQLSGNDTHKKRRDKRNQVITYLTNEEYYNCMDKLLYSYQLNSTYGADGRIPRDSFSRTANHPPKHIAEMSVLQTDGSRYVYGLPAYNHVQKEATFNVAQDQDGFDTGKSTYDAGDNSINNQKGLDYFFSRTTLPKFSHSFFLTQVLSSDYVDVNEDGPTDDDLGNWVKFNYTKVHSDYKWRAPFEANSANYSENQRSNKRDQKGAYLYGEKDIHYIHSIESRSYITEFKYSDRFDSYGVLGENGGIDTTRPLKKIDKIYVYSREDRIRNGAQAVPVKVIHFEYDYSLCKQLPNNKRTGISSSESGKLTLKKVYFTYGRDPNGFQNPYEFDYGFNPDYSYKNFDRWGSYKAASSTITNFDFPYAEQYKSTADSNASAWHLTAVKLPSGGTMTVNYEADDYAFVQNKPAGKMVKILGFASDSTSQPNDYLVDGSNNPKQYLFFELSSAATTKSDITPYIRDLQYLYFKTLVRLGKKDNAADSYYEYITGYAEVEKEQYGVNGGKGWVRLKNKPMGDREGSGEAHPICRAAWQYTRLQYPQIAYEGSDNPDNDLKKIFLAMVSVVPEVIRMFRGFNADMLAKKKGIKVDLDKSFVRLYDEDGFKYGGGSRVRSIVLDNRWGNMVGGEFNDEFGNSYEYTTRDGISSGVATYEPIIGGDENTLKEPVIYREGNIGAPDNDYMVEKPFGESLYPSAAVGYSRVKVKSLKKGGGFVVNEFYTAKDFPSITQTTDLDIQGPPIGAEILKLFGYYYATDAASQGYSIELNDMHGRPKSTFNYNDNDPEHYISGVEYKYAAEPYGTGLRLNNVVTAINNKGEVIRREIGKEVDFVTDFQQSENSTKSVGQQFNIDLFLIPAPFPIPIPVPTGLPDLNFEYLKFNSAVSTKVIQKCGILKEVIAYENGARVSTENLAYDEESGQVLLTRTKNDFENPVYNLTIPAHFAYDGMGPAYKNIGLEFDNVTFTNGIISGLPDAVSNYFVPGDEIGCTSMKAKIGSVFQLFGGNKLWVLPNYTFVNQDGSLYSTNGRYVSIKILRSGRRNMQSVPIATYTTLDNPITYTPGGGDVIGNINGIGTNTKILAASASEFSDKWFTNCQKTLVSYDSCLLKSKIEMLADLNWLAKHDKLIPLYSYHGNTGELLNGNFERPIPSTIEATLNSSCNFFPCAPSSTVVQDFFQAMDFTSDHQYKTGAGAVNSIKISNVASGVCTIYDHTKGDTSGRMLMVDGKVALDTSFSTSWMPYNAIDVQPGERYSFSFWINAGCYPVPGAVLPQINSWIEGPFGGGMASQQFDYIYYNDTLVNSGMVTTVPDSGRWHQINCIYTIPSYIRSIYPTINSLNNSSGGGNDFLLDDISFLPALNCPWKNVLADSSTLVITKPSNNGSYYNERNGCRSCNIALKKDTGDHWFFSDVDTFLDLLPVTATSQSNDYKLIVRLNNTSIDTLGAESDCICTDEYKVTQTCEDRFTGTIINPYKQGLLGNWRKTRDWLYDNDRSYLYASTAGGASPTFESDIKTDGVFKTFTPFWKYSSGSGKFITDPAGWTWTNLVTKYNENGQEIENKDALGRYSAALFGFNHAIALAVASNAKYNQIAYDGAEEYTYYDALPICKTDHFSFREGMSSPNGITDRERHTGKFSIEVKANDEVFNLRDSVFTCTTPDTADYTPAEGQPFIMKSCMCKGQFFPDSGRYYFSAWVKENTGCSVFSYNTATIEVEMSYGSGSTSTVTIHPKGKIIEGWQKMDTVFTVPAGLVSIKTTLKAGTNDAYYDDIRIQPFNSSMKSFAYDAITLNLLGELDANNYATIYEYDASKKLIRIKKETENGVLMIKEFKEKQSYLRP